MLFEDKVKRTNYSPTKQYKKVRIDLEPERENKLQIINKVYSNEVYSNNRRLGRTKLIKMAIDNLIADVEEQASEEEAIEFLRTLYKEAEF